MFIQVYMYMYNVGVVPFGLNLSCLNLYILLLSLNFLLIRVKYFRIIVRLEGWNIQSKKL